MKPSAKALGQYLQVFLIQRGHQVDRLAAQMGISAEALSNLIHGRRRFRDHTLRQLAETPILRDGGVTLAKLKALRCLDEYSLEEITLTLLEGLRRGDAASLPASFLPHLRQELARDGLPEPYQQVAQAALEQVCADAP